jgi:hypothetical protein
MKPDPLDPRVDAFVESELGAASSHPRFIRRKIRWLLHGPLAFLLLVAGWFLWKGVHLDLRAIAGALSGNSLVLAVFLGVLVFLVSAAATAVLVMRASLAQGLSALRRESADLSFNVTGLLVVFTGAAVTVMLGFLLPRLLPADLAAPLLKYGFILSFLPYLLTLVALDLFTPGQRSGVLGRLGFAAAGLMIAAFVVSTKPQFAVQILSALGLDGVNARAFGGAVDTAAQSLFRLLGFLLSFALLWFLGEWVISGIPSEKPESPPAPAPTASWWRRLLALLRRLLRPAAPAVQAAAPSPSPAPAPDWLQETCTTLHAALPGVLRKAPELRPAGPLQGAPLSKESTYDVLFGGVRPTEDQAAVLTLFLEKGKVGERKGAGGRDLLLEGENGVGKTTTLLACALHSLLVRGERCAVFAPDATSREQMVRLLTTWLDGLMVGHSYRVGELSKSEVGLWLVTTEEFPDILVAGPAEWEAAFFGGLCDELKPIPDGATARQIAGTNSSLITNARRIRYWLRSFTTFLVDDVASHAWTPLQVTHLPFIIDKQRLILATCGRKLQLLASTTRLSSVAATSVGEYSAEMISPARDALVHRLFGEMESPRLRENFFILRNWRHFEPQRVEVSCTAAEPVIFQLVRECLLRRRQVVFFMPVRGLGQTVQLQEDFRSKLRAFWAEHPLAGAKPDPALDPAMLRIVSHINENIGTLAVAGAEGRVLVYEGNLRDNIMPQLFSRYGSEDTTVFAIDTSESREVTTGPMPYPLLVAREASSLAVAHLRSAAIHIPIGRPVSRDELSICGIARAGMAPALERSDLRGWEAEDDLRFELDPREGSSQEEKSELNPLVLFLPLRVKRRLPSPESYQVPAKPVIPNPDKAAMLDFGLRYGVAPGGIELLFGRVPENDKARKLRHAKWVDANDQEIEQVDLAYCDELEAIRVTTNQAFWCRKLQFNEKQGSWEFYGDPRRGTANEATVPYWKLKLRNLFPCPPAAVSAESERLGLDGPWQGTPPLVQVVELFLVPGGGAGTPESGQPAAEQVAATAAPAFEARVEILGALNGATRKKTQGFNRPAAFDYTANVVAVVLGRQWSQEEQGARLAELIARPWDTAASGGEYRFWAGLTLALQSGIRQFAPRFTKFCRLAAFRIPGGGAIVFFIEPVGTAGTIRPLLKALVDFPEHTAMEVCRPALKALRESAWTGPGFADEKVEDAVAIEFLLQCLSGEAVIPVSPEMPPQPANPEGGGEAGEGEDSQRPPAPPVVPTAIAPAPDLPPLPLQEGREYSCGKCTVRFTVKPGPGSSVCHCGVMLRYIAETASAGEAYAMQFLTGAKWPNAAACPAPAGSTARVEAMWLEVAEKVTYQKDEETFAGRVEVWQTPEETLRAGFGDCEDHSILLVDWLLSEGYEARVVIGESLIGDGKWGGHAWVVLRLEGKEYLIEATSDLVGPDGSAPQGKELKRLRQEHLKLEGIEAKADSYRPEGMFDRGRYWLRKGIADGKPPVAPQSYWSGDEEWIEGMWLRSTV